MSCGGCHHNSNNAEIAPNVNWPKSGDFGKHKRQSHPFYTQPNLTAFMKILNYKLSSTNELLQKTNSVKFVKLQCTND
jgi:hypothetical protein